MRNIDKDKLIARLQRTSVSNGGWAIIPDVVYEIIEEEWADQLDVEVGCRMREEEERFDRKINAIKEEELIRKGKLI